MAMFKIKVKDAETQHKQITVMGGPCTAKQAYEYGKSVGLDILGLEGSDIHVEVEEQPAK